MSSKLLSIVIAAEQKGQIFGILCVGCDRETAAAYVGCSPADIASAMRQDRSFANTVRRTEAAAEQGYGWQYAYLFFVNQEEADRFGVSEEENSRAGLKKNFLLSIAGSVEELNGPEWEEALEEGKEPGSAMEESLKQQEELGSKLCIRFGQARSRGCQEP